jgi:hypothetical protein
VQAGSSRRAGSIDCGYKVVSAVAERVVEKLSICLGAVWGVPGVEKHLPSVVTCTTSRVRSDFFEKAAIFFQNHPGG